MYIPPSTGLKVTSHCLRHTKTCGYMISFASLIDLIDPSLLLVVSRLLLIYSTTPRLFIFSQRFSIYQDTKEFVDVFEGEQISTDREIYPRKIVLVQY